MNAEIRPHVPHEIANPYLAGALPFGDIPLERERKVDTGTKAVALHELGHAFMAFKENISVDFISVIPNASQGYLGVTKLSYIPPDEYKLQKVAAAGSLFSHAGNGGDRGVMRSLQHKTGKSEDEAFASSAAELRNYLSDAEWDIAAEILVRKGRMYGSDIPSLIQRAKIEAKWRESNGENIDLTWVDQVAISWAKARVKSSEERLIGVPEGEIKSVEVITEPQENGTIVSYQVENGSVITDSIEITCAHCKNKSSHAENCTNQEIDLNPAAQFAVFPQPELPKIGLSRRKTGRSGYVNIAPLH